MLSRCLDATFFFFKDRIAHLGSKSKYEAKKKCGDQRQFTILMIKEHRGNAGSRVDIRRKGRLHAYNSDAIFESKSQHKLCQSVIRRKSLRAPGRRTDR